MQKKRIKCKRVFRENTNRERENVLNRERLNPRDMDIFLNPDAYK